ncbi:MAG: 3-methyl-2-oxobutanoate hydroxymethyltransferase [Burkholderiaceae bacterium]|nr:3-methyl-2-oxobutanoate hydroxymethyltransferase [Burkholderiaceae bacterium]
MANYGIDSEKSASGAARKAVTLRDLKARKTSGERIVMLTCYDASFSQVLDDCGVDVLLIGDSLGMVLQGHASTLPVTMDQIVYHTECVARPKPKAWVLADMPFGSYQESPAQAYANAARLMAAGAQMVKIEGGAWLAPTVEFLTQRGIPVCAHLGLTPQSVHQLGGYRVQGRDDAAAKQLIADAKLLQTSGADMVLVELIPTPLGRALTESLSVPTIGIGAGPHTTGQVLVLHDILDVTPGKKARFVKNYMAGAGSIREAISRYVAEVRSGAYPAPEHGFES